MKKKGIQQMTSSTADFRFDYTKREICHFLEISPSMFPSTLLKFSVIRQVLRASKVYVFPSENLCNETYRGSFCCCLGSNILFKNDDLAPIQ